MRGRRMSPKFTHVSIPAHVQHGEPGAGTDGVDEVYLPLAEVWVGGQVLLVQVVPGQAGHTAGKVHLVTLERRVGEVVEGERAGGLGAPQGRASHQGDHRAPLDLTVWILMLLLLLLLLLLLHILADLLLLHTSSLLRCPVQTE